MRYILLIATLVLGAILLIVPHHVSPPNYAERRSYRLCDIIRESANSSDTLESPRAALFYIFLVIIALWTFFPAWLLLLIGFLPKPVGGGFVALFVIQGVIALIMTGLAMVLMVIQQTGFGWGASNMGVQTFWFFVIPAIEGAFALWSFVMGCWPTLGRLMYEWIR